MVEASRFQFHGRTFQNAPEPNDSLEDFSREIFEENIPTIGLLGLPFLHEGSLSKVCGRPRRKCPHQAGH